MRGARISRVACALLVAATWARAQDRPTPAADARVEAFELNQATVADATRLLSELSGWNIAVTAEASAKTVTLHLSDVPARVALETLCKVAGLWFREADGVVRVMTAEEYQGDLEVKRDAQVRVYTLLHPNPEAVAVAIRDVFGPRVTLSLGYDTRFQGTQLLGGAGSGAAGVGGGAGFGAGARGGFAGQGTLGNSRSPFSSAAGGGAFGNAFGLGNAQTNGAGSGRNGRSDGSERITDETLSAERLSRLGDQDGVLSGDELRGVTDGLPRIYVTANGRHNLVVVRTTDTEALDQISELVLELDRPTPQVLLEVKILEVRLGDGFDSAFDVSWSEGPARTNPADGKSANPLLPSAAGVVEQVAQSGSFPIAGGGALIYQFLDEHVRVRMQLLEREDRLATLSTPLLLCANDEEARVFIGEERPLVRDFNVQTNVTNGVVTTQVEPTVELRDIGNTLRLVPSINADRTVTLTIVQDVSSLIPGGATLPVPDGQGGVAAFAVDTVNTANVSATVVAKDGMTLALGGLIRKSISDGRSGIPYLMDLPLIGWLFGSTSRQEEQREFVLLVTPHVLMTPAEGRARSEARMRALSLHPFHDVGDTALNRYTRSDVPGTRDYGLLVEDYLLSAPEPIR